PSLVHSVSHRALHSFPTRRSSDLHGQRERRRAHRHGEPCTAHLLLHEHAFTIVAGPSRASQRGALEGSTAEELLQGSKRNADRRSEEHTSELQSRENLVCRLLLEK